MDLLGYAALGGLERITIVAGAVIIGYWGYRLYTADKNAGLIFMGLAVVVLIGALATGTSHVQSITEGYQLASIPGSDSTPTHPETAAQAADAPFIETPVVEIPVSETPVAETPIVETPVAGEKAPAPGSVAEVPPTVDGTAVEPVAVLVVEDETAIVTGVVPETMDSPVRRLASGQELGGRIVSVQSENVSLEWSPPPKSD